MAARVNPRIIVQADWDVVLREDGGKAWTTFRNDDSTSDRVHSSIKCHGVSSSGAPYVSASDGFAVKEISKKSLTLSYNGEGSSHQCLFQAPHTNFTNIHKRHKKIESLDATSGGLAVSTDGKNVLVWTTNNGEVRRQLEGHVADVTTCRFFPSGVVILTGADDMQVKIWSAENGQCAASLTGHTAGISDTAVVDRGRNVISVSRDGTARLWDCGSKTCLAVYQELGGVVNACSLGETHPDIHLHMPDEEPGDEEVGSAGKMLLLAMENGVLQGYGLRSRKQIFSYECSSAVNCCSFLSENLAVCGTDDSSIYLLDLRNPSCPMEHIKESRGPIHSLLPYKRGIFATTGDGSCFYVNEDYVTSVELTGSDCDPIYNSAWDGSYLYNCCRDGNIRKYKLPI